MSVRVAVGLFKNNLVAQSSAIAVGTSILQNRNQTKGNQAMLAVGDGIHLQPSFQVIHEDQDMFDAFSMDGPNNAITRQA